MTVDPDLPSLKAFIASLAQAWSTHDGNQLLLAYAPLVVRIRDSLPKLAWSNIDAGVFDEQFEFNQQCGLKRAVVAAQLITCLTKPFYKLDLRWRLEPNDAQLNQAALTFDASYVVRQRGLEWEILVAKTRNFFESYDTYRRLGAGLGRP